MGQDGTTTSRPECYGVLEKVFPRGKTGLREVRERCWNCAERVECLRAATAQGEQHRVLSEERAGRDSALVGGVAGFLQRWSRLKHESKKGGQS